MTNREKAIREIRQVWLDATLRKGGINYSRIGFQFFW
jgi:hypothetical protein